ncbi:hypothetical protein CDV36_014642 [Fusarium kuroshium]|uniref:cysteine dioxygenase n=1 Tax=Fusarium kuroshium TaxID=2010991 RepID=A0A3M2RHG1_9HYPO|nr:hypothetical protein CDV36_014642 [Fusarium kuroshium]
MADPSHFSDPFWTPPQPTRFGYVQAASRRIPYSNYVTSLVRSRVASPVSSGGLVFLSEGSSYIDSVLELVTPRLRSLGILGPDTDKSLGASDDTVGVTLKIGGLGTISARSELPKTNLKFTIGPKDHNAKPILVLTVTKQECIFEKLKLNSDEYETLEEFPGPEPEEEDRSKYFNKFWFPKGKPSALLNEPASDKTTYWISVDRSNARIRYGQHLLNNSMTFMEVLFDPNDADWMTFLSSVKVYRDDIRIHIDDIRSNDTPVTTDLPPLVVPQDQITLEQLENMSAMTWASLPEGCQKLYHNISGPNITARPGWFPDLPQAIQWSCSEPYRLCGSILESKKGEFGDKTETYLRITVGDNLANSPGIPYVMEIWPRGHKSPIHQHGDASAVIRVLHGSIKVTWYDALKNGREPKRVNNPVTLSKGDMTWLGENQYQIHQLENVSDDVCITLQCYQFEKDNTIHDEKFHWMDGKRQIRNFVPNSDMAYGRFLEKMKNEWKEHNKKRTFF